MPGSFSFKYHRDDVVNMETFYFRSTLHYYCEIQILNNVCIDKYSLYTSEISQNIIQLIIWPV